MFVIKNKQMEAFRQIEVEKFVQKSVVFLQNNFADWCVDKERDEIEAFIYEMIDFGEQYDIKKQLNLQKLMFFKIEFGFDVPLVEGLEEILGDIGKNESWRVKCFYKSLLNSDYSSTQVDKEQIDWLF